MQKGMGFFFIRQFAVGKDDDAFYKQKILRRRRMAVLKLRVPPLVLTRSGNAGRATYAPLSLSREVPMRLGSRLPVQLCCQYMTVKGGCQVKNPFLTTHYTNNTTAKTPLVPHAWKYNHPYVHPLQ
jgi:hypothetical protein